MEEMKAFCLLIKSDISNLHIQIAIEILNLWSWFQRLKYLTSVYMNEAEGFAQLGIMPYMKLGCNLEEKIIST